jgi:hypothetical protein
MLRTGHNEVVFSQDHPRLCVGGRKNKAVTIPLSERDGLYELRVTPLYLGEERQFGTLSCFEITMENDPRLWDTETSRMGYSTESAAYALPHVVDLLQSIDARD